MKQVLIIKLVLLVALLLACIALHTIRDVHQEKAGKKPHSCIDPSHNSCDGSCKCDGLACQ